MRAVRRRQRDSRANRRRRAGLSLVELMFVVGIIALLLTVIVGGAYAVGRWSKDKATTSRLQALDSIVQEYHRETRRYLPPALAANPNHANPADPNHLQALRNNPNMREFIQDAYTVGEIDKMITALGSGLVATRMQGGQQVQCPVDEAESLVVLDGGGNPILIFNPNTTTAATEPPRVWSIGFDGANNSGPGGPAPWVSGANYSAGAIVSHEGHVFVCKQSPATPNKAPEQGVDWELTDDLVPTGR